MEEFNELGVHNKIDVDENVSNKRFFNYILIKKIDKNLTNFVF